MNISKFAILFITLITCVNNSTRSQTWINNPLSLSIAGFQGNDHAMTDSVITIPTVSICLVNESPILYQEEAPLVWVVRWVFEELIDWGIGEAISWSWDQMKAWLASSSNNLDQLEQEPALRKDRGVITTAKNYIDQVRNEAEDSSSSVEKIRSNIAAHRMKKFKSIEKQLEPVEKRLHDLEDELRYSQVKISNDSKQENHMIYNLYEFRKTTLNKTRVKFEKD
jgi:hypothetical protein